MMSTANERTLCFMSIVEMSERLASREFSPVEVTRAVLDRCERHNEEMRAFITITREVALEQAQEAEREIRVGSSRGPLHGVPVSLKDNVATRGIRTSCASMVAPDWVPDTDAAVYTRLREAGAVLIGKANLNEYAFSLNPAFPPPLNPWRADLSSAGSSSGSGVAVAAGMSYGSIGSDTGGSGRAPANANGAVGFKATYGRVSRWGVFPLSYSLDHITPMTRSVTDSALMLQAIAGYDARDENAADAPVPDFAAKIGRDIRAMRVGVARGFTYENVDSDVVAMIEGAIRVFERLGATVEEVRLPHVEHCLNTYTAVMNPEAATIHYDNLRRHPEGFGQRARERLDLGNVIPATAYVHGQRVRKLMRDGLREVFQRFDVLINPAAPTRTGAAGGTTTTINGREIDNRELGDGYTNYYSLTGAPALVLPGGFSSEEAPIGLQIAGPWFDEMTVLQAAHAFEQATDWHLRRPPNPKTEV